MDGWYGTEGKYRGYIAELTAEFCVEVWSLISSGGEYVTVAFAAINSLLFLTKVGYIQAYHKYLLYMYYNKELQIHWLV